MIARARQWLAERAFKLAYWLGSPWWRRYRSAGRVFYEGSAR